MFTFQNAAAFKFCQQFFMHGLPDGHSCSAVCKALESCPERFIMNRFLVTTVNVILQVEGFGVRRIQEVRMAVEKCWTPLILSHDFALLL